MNYSQLIRKLLAGGEINALERAELEQFDPDAVIMEKENISKERDQLKAEQLSFKRGQKLQEIAKKFNCSDPEFLDYLTAKNKLDLNNAQAVESFLDDLQKKSPHCFYSSIKSSGGDRAPLRSAEVQEISPHDRIGKIAASLVNAPAQQ